MFITTRNGDVLSMTNGVISSTPYLNFSTAGINVYTGGEGGLLGLALSPNFATDHKFYTFDTEPFSTSGPAADFSSPELFPTTSTNPNNQIVIREWTQNAANPNVANTTSRVLMRINHPQSNHQGGSMRFGPDGNLYIGLGDGGSGNDFSGSATSNTDGHNNAIGNGQDTTVPFGKILRIDPNGNNSANGQYGIPASNPFASGVGGMKEIYAYGLRNPYRFSFDPTSGSMFVGDVGQDNREEVDVVQNGGNYGWPFREGTRDNSGANGSGRTLPTGFASVAPIGEYTHGDGEAVMGGYVYRGTAVPALTGDYVFGDLGNGTTNAVGRLFVMPMAGGTITELKYDGSGIAPSSNLYGFAETTSHELLAIFADGSIVAINAVPEPAAGALVLAGAGAVLLRRRRRRGR
jgi:glucose/arabinose dehydrogenase